MEQLIIFVIIAIVSSLFGKSKNKEQQQMPSFGKDDKPQPPVVMHTEESKPTRPTVNTQSFEDFARGFLGDMQGKADIREERVKPKTVEVVEQAPSYVAPPLIPTEAPSRATGRPSMGRMTASKKEARVMSANKAFELPTSKQALVQAVVMAEILGPPKAKRK